MRALLARGEDVRALVRDPDRSDLPHEVDVVVGDASEPASLERALKGADAAFLLSAIVGPGRGRTSCVTRACPGWPCSGRATAVRWSRPSPTARSPGPASSRSASSATPSSGATGSAPRAWSPSRSSTSPRRWSTSGTWARSRRPSCSTTGHEGRRYSLTGRRPGHRARPGRGAVRAPRPPAAAWWSSARREARRRWADEGYADDLADALVAWQQRPGRRRPPASTPRCRTCSGRPAARSTDWLDRHADDFR